MILMSSTDPGMKCKGTWHLSLICTGMGQTNALHEISAKMKPVLLIDLNARLLVQFQNKILSVNNYFMMRNQTTAMNACIEKSQLQTLNANTKLQKKKFSDKS